jgi:hypothetical protein
LTTVALYKVGEQSFVLSGQSVLERTLKGIAVGESDTVFLTKDNKITPGAMVTFSKLTNERTDAGCLLCDNQLSSARP